VARDKLIAHSEHRVQIDSLPSFDAMEQLFFFGSDFYGAVSSSFVGSGPADLDRGIVKRDLVKLLRAMGIQEVRTEMK
jgi:hypothetical protein